MPAAATVNHLLAQEPWARTELKLHAGKVAVIDASPAVLRLRVTADGMVEAAASEAPAAVTIRLKLGDLPLIAQNRERAFSYVQIEGDAEFANAISRLSQSLRWEAEYDLEKLVGPIAAVRLVQGAKAVVQGAPEAITKLLVETRAPAANWMKSSSSISHAGSPNHSLARWRHRRRATALIPTATCAR